MMQHKMAKAALCIAKAQTKVRTNITRTKIVAIILVLANIFLSWLQGPMRKHVLARDKMLPIVYKTANMTRPFFRNIKQVPRMERKAPRIKHNRNSLILVPQLSVVTSFICVTIPLSSSSSSFPLRTFFSLSIVYFYKYANNG